ncbi:MAG: hypothetical protein ACYSUQ_15220, partial [Planctomycetota bacterium]
MLSSTESQRVNLTRGRFSNESLLWPGAFRHRLGLHLVLLGFLAAGGPLALAQEEPPADPLDAVRERASFGASDDQVIDTWLTARIDELIEASGPGTESENAADDEQGDRDKLVDAGLGFRRTFQTQMRHPGNTPQFVTRFAERTG